MIDICIWSWPMCVRDMSNVHHSQPLAEWANFSVEGVVSSLVPVLLFNLTYDQDTIVVLRVSPIKLKSPQVVVVLLAEPTTRD